MGKVTKRIRQEKMIERARKRRLEQSLSKPLFKDSKLRIETTKGDSSSSIKAGTSISTRHMPVAYLMDETRNIPSATLEPRKVARITRPTYEGEMLQREIEAQKEIARKKMRVAPAYNKGAYQYITDETDPSDLGRKK